MLKCLSKLRETSPPARPGLPERCSRWRSGRCCLRLRSNVASVRLRSRLWRSGSAFRREQDRRRAARSTARIRLGQPEHGLGQRVRSVRRDLANVGDPLGLMRGQSGQRIACRKRGPSGEQMPQQTAKRVKIARRSCWPAGTDSLGCDTVVPFGLFMSVNVKLRLHRRSDSAVDKDHLTVACQQRVA